MDYFYPKAGPDVEGNGDFLDLNSGYIQGLQTNYLSKFRDHDKYKLSKDLFQVRFKSIEDSDLKFKKAS